MSLFAELTSGGIGGAIGIVVTQPIDTIRVRLQTQNKKNNIRGVATSILRNEGVRGLYKGVASPIVTTGFMNAVLFFSYESAASYVRRKNQNQTGDNNAQLTLQQVAFCGLVSGIPSSCINSPTELVKCKAQVCVESKGYIYEEWVIFTDMLKKNGITGRYGPLRGLGITLLRDVPSYGLYFYVYESFVRTSNRNGYDGNIVTLFAGGFAGTAAWGSIYPIDVVKTRWQTASVGQYKNLFQCIHSIYTNEGIAAFSKGFGATMLKAWPQNAVIFFTYELLMSSVFAT
mmetsp:Transcript_20874/g.26613  ORF Transcript_20874/g.26613 Transcript_20874/m.26613 type:complete len:287 (-) Transcript_20874:417-1277(-)